jgi:hypothetical protein
VIIRPTNVTWRREPRAVLKSLPDERKALAERYTIDADEAQRREQLAEEQAATRAAAEAASRRAAAQEAARRAAEEGARRAEEEEAARRAAIAAMEEELQRQKEAEAVPSAKPERAAAPRPTRLTPRRRARMTPASFPGQQSVTPPTTEPPDVEVVFVDPEPTPIQESVEETADLPIYRWFGNG